VVRSGIRFARRRFILCCSESDVLGSTSGGLNRFSKTSFRLLAVTDMGIVAGSMRRLTSFHKASCD
jgi:hypothetical protein